jgi:sarcosine oxidase
MGSASAMHMARAGMRVAGFDRERPPHSMGSTHGRTRIIREAYFEHPDYVPLVQKAYELWAGLELESGRELFIRTGGLMCGPADGMLASGTLRSVEEHRLPHEILRAGEIRARFPALVPSEEWIGILEPRAGMLLPEACVTAQLELAGAAGATLMLGEPVTSWDVSSRGVRVRSSEREILAKQLVIAAGSWLPEVAPDLGIPLDVERQMLHWFQPTVNDRSFSPERCPIGLWEWEPGRLLTTFPDTGDGVKCGIHHEGEITTPESVRRTTSPAEDAMVREILAKLIPSAAGRQLESRVCLYTNTTDHHFLIDRHPAHEEVLIVSACSGHGFKFASAIGAVVADLVREREPGVPMNLFRKERLLSLD